MSYHSTNPIGIILLGCLYGTVLGALALVAAGFGHGTYIFIGASSAPLGFLGIPAALLGTPAVWGLIRWLLKRVMQGEGKRPLIAVLAVHYISGLALLSVSSFGDWQYLNGTLDAVPLVVAGWLVVYAGGQLGLWVIIARFPLAIHTA